VALAPGVQVSGDTRPQRLLHWPRPGDHARKLGIIHLRAEGAPHFHALLQLDQGADRTGKGPLADTLIFCYNIGSAPGGSLKNEDTDHHGERVWGGVLLIGQIQDVTWDEPAKKDSTQNRLERKPMRPVRHAGEEDESRYMR
jgi:hypothetical protein